jgi:hypothetical protein
MTEELSVNDMLHDPLIRQLLRADRISLPSFAVFLHDAVRRQGTPDVAPSRDWDLSRNERVLECAAS